MRGPEVASAQESNAMTGIRSFLMLHGATVTGLAWGLIAMMLIVRYAIWLCAYGAVTSKDRVFHTGIGYDIPS